MFSMNTSRINGMKVAFDPTVKNLIENLSALLNVKITIFSLDSEEGLVGYHSMDSDFCSLLQNKLGIIDKCRMQDKKTCTLCLEKKESIIYQCHAGLTEIIIPIIKEDIIAYAIVGQFRLHNTIPETLIQSWKSKGYSEEEIKNAFLERPYYSRKQAEEIRDIVQSILELQITADRLRLSRPEIIDQVYSYIDSNIDKDISLDSLSVAISRSKSTITHRLKESTGMSFTQIVIERRLNRLEELISHDPDLNFKEAASQIGFSDPLYLSRIYKKKRGHTLTEFRDGIRLSIKK